MAKSKIFIKAKSHLHFKFGTPAKGVTLKKVSMKAGEILEVDPDDIKNLSKYDFDIVTSKETEKKA